jgi:hypothetical protein
MTVPSAKRFAAMCTGIALALAACSPAQQQQATTAQTQVAALCGVAMSLAPTAPSIAPWIIGGCGTEQAIATLALDPSSQAWLAGLVAQAKVIHT